VALMRTVPHVLSWQPVECTQHLRVYTDIRLHGSAVEKSFFFLISTFLYRFLCAELKEIIKSSITYHFFHKTNFPFQGLFIYIHTYWTINTVNGTEELRADTGPKTMAQ
jgi:hypothetical protein